jgi:hypothetical protein
MAQSDDVPSADRSDPAIIRDPSPVIGGIPRRRLSLFDSPDPPDPWAALEMGRGLQNPRSASRVFLSHARRLDDHSSTGPHPATDPVSSPIGAIYVSDPSKSRLFGADLVSIKSDGR